MPRIATAPALVIGLLSASLFGLFYMAALNNPSIIKPPRPVAMRCGTCAKAGCCSGTCSGAGTRVPIAAADPHKPDPHPQSDRGEMRR